MTPGQRLIPRPCRSCATPVLVAKRVPSGKWSTFDPTHVAAGSMASAGALVLLDATREAWRPQDLAEHWHVTREIPESKARELVAEYPHHRRHQCEGDT